MKMRPLFCVAAAGIGLACGLTLSRSDAAPAEGTTAPATSPATPTKPMSFYDFKMKALDGKEIDFHRYQGKVLLVLNTASKCGNTPQYAPLEKMSQEYASKGLVVLGFPANNFNNQEPGSDSEIAEFCQKNYGVKFQMFSKVSVKGDDISPLFKYLTTEANPALKGDIDWNFGKFLISRDGKLVARFPARTSPYAPEVVKAIDAELAKK